MRARPGRHAMGTARVRGFAEFVSVLCVLALLGALLPVLARTEPAQAAPAAGFERVPSTTIAENDPAPSAVAVDEKGTFHVAYRASLANGSGIFVRSSSDGGVTWTKGTLVSDAAEPAYLPAIVANGAHLFVSYLTYTCWDSNTRCAYWPTLAVLDLQGTRLTWDWAIQDSSPYEPVPMAALGSGVLVAGPLGESGSASAPTIRSKFFVYDATRHSLELSDFWDAPGTEVRVAGDGSAATAAVVDASGRVRMHTWLDTSEEDTQVDLGSDEKVAGLAAAGGRAHLVTVKSDGKVPAVWSTMVNGVALEVHPREQPAEQTGEVRVRTFAPAANVLPTRVVAVGSTPRYPQVANLAVAARSGLVALAWEDASSRSILTASSADGGLSFGAGTVVPGSTTADNLQLAVAAAVPTTRPVVRWDWSVAERYAPDGNGALVPWLGNVPAAPTLATTLDGCASTVAAAPATYRWTVDGTDLPEATCRVTARLTANTPHQVRLEVTDDKGTASTQERTITPRDLLVVSIGDSIASGEGNPTVPASYSYDGTITNPTNVTLQPEEWVDQACHRSAAAGPAQAARRLERLDRHSSITFVHLACSGASVMSGDVVGEPENPWETGGLLDPYQGIEPLVEATSEQTAAPSQLQQLKDKLAGSGRSIDAMFVSVGANDVRFSDVVRECIKSRLTDPRPCNTSATGTRLDQRLGDLPRRYQALADALGADHPELASDPSRVFITEYFDPTTDSLGQPNLQCIANADKIAAVTDFVSTVAGLAVDLGVKNPIVAGLAKAADLLNRVFDGGLVTDTEAAWAHTEVVGKLNAAVRAGATKNGWTYVGGIADGFLKHGYCADDGARWVVQIGDSLRDQFDANGPVHPNADGHQVFARALSRAASRIVLTAAVDSAPSSPSAVPASDLGEAVLGFRVNTWRGNYFNPGDPAALYVANLHDRGVALEATEVRMLDRVVGAPAETVGFWYQGTDLAVNGAAAVATWIETSTPATGPGTRYDTLTGLALMARPNIAVDKVRLVQAPDDALRLAAGKATVVRAQLRARLATATDVEVHVVVTGNDGTVYEKTTRERLRPGVNDVVLPGASVLTPKAGDSWQAKVLVTEPGATAPDESPNSDDVGVSDVLNAVTTVPMKVLFAPVGGTGASCEDAVRVATRSVPYARAALPLPDKGLTAAYGGLVAPGATCPVLRPAAKSPAGVDTMLADYNRLARLAGVDAVVGIVPAGWLGDAFPDERPWGIANMPTNGPPFRGVILEGGVFDNVLTHELSHLHGLDHTDRSATTGLWVERRQARSGPDYLFRPAQPTRWAHPQTFDDMLEARRGLGVPVPAGAGEAVVVSGSVAGDTPGSRTVTLDPALVSAPAADAPATGSPLVVVQRDAGGDIVASGPIGLFVTHADYPGDSPPVVPTGATFSAAVTLSPTTTTLQVVLDGKVAASRAVTAHVPVVTVTSPTAGTTMSPGSTLNVGWTATDDDGDALTHSVLLSLDGGANWQPVAVGLTGTTYSTTLPASFVGANARIRVVSSDGVRSGVGEVDFGIVAQARGPQRIAYSALAASTDCPNGSFQGCDRGIRTMLPDGTDDQLVVPWSWGNNNTGVGRFLPYDPRWSPDGRTLLFTADAYTQLPSLPGVSPTAVRRDLYAVDADGTNLRQVSVAAFSPSGGTDYESNLMRYECADWSPDGSRIVALGTGDGGYSQIVTMRADGTDLRFHGRIAVAHLAFDGKFARNTAPCPRWSPDGTRIAMAVDYSPSSSALPTMPNGAPWTPVFSYGDTDTSQVITVWSATAESTTAPGTVLAGIGHTTVNEPPKLFGADWTPDGSALLVGTGYQSDLGCGIVRVESDGSGTSRILNCPKVYTPNPPFSPYQQSNFVPTAPQVTPDGRIAFGIGYPWSYTPGTYELVPTLCTIPGGSTAGTPTYAAYEPTNLSCLTAPGVLSPAPTTSGVTAKTYLDWSAGPVLGGGGTPAPSLEVTSPAADAGGPYTVDEDVDVELDATASGLGVDGSDFAWDIDGDGAFDDATGAMPTVRFADPGDRSVAVKVTNGTTTATATATVTVRSVAPDVSAPSTLSALAGTAADLGPFTVRDPGSTGVRATVDLPDAPGATATVEATGVRVRATFAAAGTASGTLSVCDDVAGGACTAVPLTVQVDATPVLDSVSPTAAAAAGGTRMLLLGRHLGGTTSVQVGGATVPAVATDTTVSFAMPAGTGGSTATVTVTGATGTATVTYRDVMAVPQRVGTAPGTALRVELLARDVAAASDVPAVHELVSGPAHGSLSPAGGATEPDPNAPTRRFPGAVVYSPAPGFVGTDSFTVRVLGDPRTATIMVKVGNEGPVAGDDDVTVPTGAVTVIDPAALLANDTDPDAADWVGVVPSGAGLRVVGVSPGAGMAGEVWLDDTGSIRFSAPPGSTPGTTTFTYLVSDPLQAATTGTVTVRVRGTDTGGGGGGGAGGGGTPGDASPSPSSASPSPSGSSPPPSPSPPDTRPGGTSGTVTVISPRDRSPISSGGYFGVTARTTGVPAGTTAYVTLDGRAKAQATVQPGGAVRFQWIPAEAGAYAVRVGPAPSTTVSAPFRLTLKPFGIGSARLDGDRVRLTIATGNWRAGTRVLVTRDSRAVARGWTAVPGRALVITVPRAPGRYQVKVESLQGWVYGMHAGVTTLR